MKKVSILGCGWVGKPLADLLCVEYEVHCLAHDIEVNDKKGFYHCDTLLIALPPKEHYLDVLKETLCRLHASTQVILLSSISFYDGKPLVVQAESLVATMHQSSVVLRLGGLMGYDRIAGKYSAGKVVDADCKTNYVHRDDVIAIIERVIHLNVTNEVFDVVAPVQSTKKQIFNQNAQKFGFMDTIFLEHTETAKTLTPNALCSRLQYRFLKEDVREFWD
jgi:nucleoside-diphosphate-sugar epimerase